MIITCPSCATRYDVEERRFLPDGRSVRCAECDESWFVPAPQPIEDLVPLKKQSRVYAEDETSERADSRRMTRDRHEAVAEEDVEEPLFESDATETRRAGRDHDRDDDRAFAGRRDMRESESLQSTPRDKKGRFIKVKKEEADFEPPSFAEDRRDARKDREPESRRFGKAARQDEKEDSRDDRRSWRAENNRMREEEPRHEQAELRADRKGRRPAVVDADFEDVDSDYTDYVDEPLSKGFGRKVREERRRETALARLEDLEPVAERIFNEEFFTALRVQPKELERAIRKARRRAEAREKNRLTPLRAIGWSAWVGAVAACAFVAYSYRNNIVAIFPNAQTAYEAVGIEANPYGLKIEGVTHRVAMSPEGPVIEILGRLRNDEKGEVAPPLLQAEALGTDGTVLSRWTFSARAAKIVAGGIADFSTRAPAPDGVSEVLLSFAPVEGVKVSVGDLLKPQN